MRSGGRMAEVVSFAVPTESDKTLLVWELSSGPTAEALHVNPVRREGGMENAVCPPPRRDWEPWSLALAPHAPRSLRREES